MSIIHPHIPNGKIATIFAKQLEYSLVIVCASILYPLGIVYKLYIYINMISLSLSISESFVERDWNLISFRNLSNSDRRVAPWVRFVKWKKITLFDVYINSHSIHVWHIYLHLHTFTIKINQMQVNIPYMDPMGICNRSLGMDLQKNHRVGR